MSKDWMDEDQRRLFFLVWRIADILDRIVPEGIAKEELQNIRNELFETYCKG